MADYAAYLRLGVDSRDAVNAKKDLDKMSDSAGKADKSFNLLGSASKVLGGALAAIGAGEIAGDLITITRETGILQASLRTATGSAENAAVAFKAINSLASQLPESVSSVSEAFTKLVNYGLNPSESAIKSYSNTASALGKDLMQMVEAVADAAAGEFERLKEFGIKSKVEGDNVSFTFRGVTKTVKNSAAEIESYLQNIGNVEFAGSASEQMKELDGAISNLGDTYDGLLRTISDQGVGDFIGDSIRSATSAIQELNDSIASGQLGAYIDAFAQKFSYFSDAAKNAFELASVYYDDFVNLFGEDISSFGSFLANAFKNLPENVAAFVQIAVVELATLYEKARVYLNTDNWFSDSSFDDLLSGINTLRTESIAQIIAERDAAVSSYEKQISLADELRKKYDEQKEESLKAGDILGQFAIKADDAAGSIDKISKQAKKLGEILEQEEIDELFSFADDPFEPYVASTKKAKKATKDFTDDAAERINGAFASAWVSVADDADSAFDGIANAFKQLLAEMAHEAITKPIILNIQQQMSGKVDGNAQTASSAIGAGGWWGAIAVAVAAGVGEYNKQQEKLFSDMTAEFRQGNQSIGTILGEANKKSDSIAGALESLDSNSGDALDVNRGMLQALLDIRSGIAGVASGFARQFGISGVGGSAGAGKSDTFGFNKSAINLGDTLADYFFDPAGILGDNAIGEFVKGFMGGITSKISKNLYSKKTKVIDEGIQIGIGQTLADILAGGALEAFAYADVQTKKKVLGVTTSNKVKTQTEALDEVLLAQFTSVFASAGDALSAASEVFGLDFQNYVNSLIIDPKKLSLKDLEGEALTKEIEAFFSSTLDNWAGVLTGGSDVLLKFQQVGEGAFETVIRLASELNTFNSYADALNLNFSLTGFAAVEASQNIAKFAGGFEQLNSSMSGYYQNFFTEEERAAKQMQMLSSELQSLGIDTVPASREAFRALIEGIDLTTEAGQKQFAAMINLQGVFAELVPVTKEAQEAIDDTADSMQKLKDAAKSAFDVLEKSINTERERIAAIVSGASSAKDALNASVNAEKDRVTAVHNERIENIKAQASAEREANQSIARARIDAIKSEKDAVEDRIFGLRSLFDELNSAAADIAPKTNASLAAARRAAEYELDTALRNARAGRGLPTDGRLSDALTAIRENPSDLYASAEQMALATARLQFKIGELSGITGKQLSNEELTLSILEKQLEAANNFTDISTEKYDKLIEQEQAAYDAQIANFDKIIADSQNAYDKLTGIDTGILSLDDAIAKFNESLLAADFENAAGEYERLDNLLSQGREQLDILMDSNIALKSLNDAIAEFSEAIKSADQSKLNQEIIAEMKRTADEITRLREEQRVQAITQQRALNTTARNTTDMVYQEPVA